LRRIILYAGAAAVSLAAGWGAGWYVGGGFKPGHGPDPQAGRERVPVSAPAPGAAAGESAAGELTESASVLHRLRPDFSLRDLDGTPRGPEEWAGSVLVVNFWATWCAPCREEIPLLIDLERRRPGVRVVGIALDTASSVQAFAKELGIGYPLLLDDLEGSTMRRYGNRIGVIPFTVFVRRDGVVAHVRAGALEAEELDRVAAALL